ncbi:sigma-54-dependent Fis family transcriptional regulator [Candidatus Poribacteria bacterium]|nr:sigma-54-dependent Fis family transcriptional regulator [Candidatus Poribacteria bacterium]
MNLPTPLSNPPTYPIIGKSEQIQSVWRKVAKVAPTDATVLITGETGVGKEVIATTVHENSQRKGKAFKAVNCGVFYQDLLQSELFGHEKGAFTGATSQRRGVFELADGGTLFLDEIAEMSPEVQVKFLRVLENQEFTRLGGERNIKVDVRIIAATNVDLKHAVQSEKFREDLYYRLNLFHIHIPPLRERREDIPLFVNAFVNELSEKHNKQVIGIKPEALNYLQNVAWYGNVRELKNAIEYAIILTNSNEIELNDMPKDIESQHTKYPIQILDEAGTSMKVVNPEPQLIATESEAVYKTILGLILSAVRLLEPHTNESIEMPSLIPDEDTSWLQVADTEDTASILRKTLDVLSTIAKAVEQRTDDGLMPLLIPENGRSGIQSPVNTSDNVEDSIGKVGMTMEEIEREAIEKTLTETGNNKTEAARILNIGVRTLHRKLDAYKQEDESDSDILISEETEE